MGCLNKLPDASSVSSMDNISQDQSCDQAKNEDLMQLLEDLKATTPDIIPEASGKDFFVFSLVEINSTMYNLYQSVEMAYSILILHFWPTLLDSNV